MLTHESLCRNTLITPQHRQLEIIRSVPVRSVGDPDPGPIAAGEKVVASLRSKVYEFLQEHYSHILAVEMEGYGFLRSASRASPTQAIVVRGISDLLAEKQKADESGSQPLAAARAAAFAVQLLSNYILPGAVTVTSSGPAKSSHSLTEGATGEGYRLSFKQLDGTSRGGVLEIQNAENLTSESIVTHVGRLKSVIANDQSWKELDVVLHAPKAAHSTPCDRRRTVVDAVEVATATQEQLLALLRTVLNIDDQSWAIAVLRLYELETQYPITICQVEHWDLAVQDSNGSVLRRCKFAADAESSLRHIARDVGKTGIDRCDIAFPEWAATRGEVSEQLFLYALKPDSQQPYGIVALEQCGFQGIEAKRHSGDWNG